MKSDATGGHDWRVSLFGPTIYTTGDEELRPLEPNIRPIQEALDKHNYDFIAVFIGADYCKHCKEFAPLVVKSSFELETERRCKVVFVSADKNQEGFKESCEKVKGLDIIPFDSTRAKNMRDLFKVKTIPALIILRNESFQSSEPAVISNARHLLTRDPTLHFIQWNKGNEKRVSPPNKLSLQERIFKTNYGRWWHLGHSSINPEHPEQMYMDEHAVRMRAGLLNIMAWIALGNVLGPKTLLVAYILYPIVGYEFLTTLLFGLGPLSPIAMIANLMTHVLRPKPLWTPARPKRFAWTIGFILATLCFAVTILADDLNTAAGMKISFPLVLATLGFCFAATWLECAAGFCIGCAIYNVWVTKVLNLEECKECNY